VGVASDPQDVVPRRLRPGDDGRGRHGGGNGAIRSPAAGYLMPLIILTWSYGIYLSVLVTIGKHAYTDLISKEQS
jgi:hypothetical protein